MLRCAKGTLARRSSPDATQAPHADHSTRAAARSTRAIRPALLRPLAGALLLSALWAACVVSPTSGSSPAHAAGPTPDAADYGTVGYIAIDDIIDRFSDRYLARAIEQAKAENVDTLLVRIDTDGGEVHHARTMFKRILDLEAEGSAPSHSSTFAQSPPVR